MSDLFTTRGQWSRSAGLSLHWTVTQTHWSKMNHSPSFTFLYLLSRFWATVTCFTSSLHTRRGNFISQPLFELFSISFALHAYHAFCIALNVHLHHWFFKLKLQMLLFLQYLSCPGVAVRRDVNFKYIFRYLILHPAGFENRVIKTRYISV